jgi:hypothetical protein
MSAVNQENATQNQTMNAEQGLRHGQFRIQMKASEDNLIEHVVEHLSQEDLAEGWRLVMPRVYQDSTIHHFSVYLSQLPPHLWKKLRLNRNKHNGEYRTINDGIYQYTVKPSKNDKVIMELYNLVQSNYPDNSEITRVYRFLEEQRVKGWVMVKARNILGL